MKPTQNKTFTQKLKGFFLKILIGLVLAFAGFFAFIYYVPYSEGTRSGELIKFSRKGVVFKTWEGELSQGISGAQIFHFSVSRNDKNLIADLERYQGKYVNELPGTLQSHFLVGRYSIFHYRSRRRRFPISKTQAK